VGTDAEGEMTERNTGGPAFPINANESADRCIYTGMTLRDYFAAKAMQGLLTSTRISKPDWIANDSYEMADAMLKAREKK
jgi:vacuolar-type H+-ATPase catalytic subunit A/Vma1